MKSKPDSTKRPADVGGIDRAMNDDEILAYTQSPFASKVAEIIERRDVMETQEQTATNQAAKNVIDNDNLAGAAISQIASLECEKAQLMNEINRADGAIGRLQSALEEYMRKVNADSQGKVKSLDFNDGRIKLIKGNDSVRLADGFKAKDYADDPFVKVETKTTYTPNRHAILAAHKEGTPLPIWATVEPGKVRFKCELK